MFKISSNSRIHRKKTEKNVISTKFNKLNKKKIKERTGNGIVISTKNKIQF